MRGSERIEHQYAKWRLRQGESRSVVCCGETMDDSLEAYLPLRSHQPCRV